MNSKIFFISGILCALSCNASFAPTSIGEPEDEPMPMEIRSMRQRHLHKTYHC